MEEKKCPHCGENVNESQMMIRIREYVKRNRMVITDEEVTIVDGKGDNYGKCVRVPLPNCNTQWTYASWDWVKAFIKEFPSCYPTHYAFNEPKCQIIQIARDYNGN